MVLMHCPASFKEKTMTITVNQKVMELFMITGFSEYLNIK